MPFPPIPDQPAPYLALVEYARSTLGDGVADELQRIYVVAAARSRRASTLKTYARQLPQMRRRLAAWERRGPEFLQALQPVYNKVTKQVALREAALRDPLAYIERATGEDEDESE